MGGGRDCVCLIVKEGRGGGGDGPVGLLYCGVTCRDQFDVVLNLLFSGGGREG